MNIYLFFYFFSWDYVLNHHHAIGYQRCLAAVFFRKAAIIIATNGQKTLHWQLSKVMLSGM